MDALTETQLAQIGQFETGNLPPCTNWHEKYLAQKLQLLSQNLAIARRNRRLQRARERYETLYNGCEDALCQLRKGKTESALVALETYLHPPRYHKPSPD
jgi:hypothetical protein